LKESDLKEILKVINKYNEVKNAVIFGRRAKGNYKNGSDVDIALKGEDLTFSIVQNIRAELNEETLMTYKFDVILYDKISSHELISHIDRIGYKIL
jgi:predicted nucleotidyltransferase